MSTYKLYYFDARGVAEPIRLLFAYANVKFEDVRFSRGPEWAKLKPQMPWNVVPVLEVDGLQISQSRAIYRFLARRFGLAPVDELLLVKCDEYIEAIVDLRTEGKKFHREADPEKKTEIMQEFLSGPYTRYMNKFTGILQNNSSGYLVGKNLTYADIFVAYTIEQIASWTGNPNSLLDNYADINNFVQRVMTLPGIQKWIEVRPKTAS